MSCVCVLADSRGRGLGGPPSDLVEFCRREHPRLVGSLTLYTGDQALSEEIAQEALTRTCERWERVRTFDAPGAWTHRVAVNIATSRFRRRGAERRAMARVATDSGGGSADADAADVIAVRRAVSSLPRRQAEALVLRFYVQLTVAETALWMDATEAAVVSLSQRGLAGLRTRLGVTRAELSGRRSDDANR